MSGAYACLLGHRDGAGRRLVRRAATSPLALALALPAVLSRAQVNTRATAAGADGTTWAEFLADVPRFNGTARRLLIGGQRTNAVRNPRAEGVVAGTPGTLPTHWSMPTSSNGITREIVGSGVEGGINYVDIRISGTASAAAFMSVMFDARAQFPLSPGGLLAISVFLRLVSGSMAGVVIPVGATNQNAGGGALNQFLTTNITPTNASLASQRVVAVATAATFNNVDTASITPFTQFNVTNGATVDCTLRIGWPQVELGASFASSPILPAVGSPAASTRGADLISATLASLGIGANGACTILGSFLLPQVSPADSPILFQLDDGTNNNRFLAANNGGGGISFVVGRTLAAAYVQTAAGTAAAGTLLRVGVAINGTGRAAMSLNGGTVQAVTGGPTSGLTTLRVGGNAGGTGPMSGEVASLSVLPFALADASLPSAVLALPS